MTKYKPSYTPSDFGVPLAYIFSSKTERNKKTGLIEYKLEILDKESGEVRDRKIFSSEKEMKEFVNINIGTLFSVGFDKKLYYK